ncbi:hypothetical protein CPU12_08965 [Malaciobacter molluscorum LMG 25693]|uniref:NIT sensor-containing MCP-domain signal transduction protein n=1 Tax=Malaciobacter molluscorum LMG 25693 TaxID=870501 RepID=A0A2G1DGV3_9BACT|nr:methyl-accepting chemotaxis protein [Malaciobacter molluscorum]AXX92300.1 NIT sensor-containing MCP-domain signal transduction protein [Malaciobacter molluscorum LMG 25693]PHO17715.1 hypothetical protein CPU12_08965 [Malaciobacter molluscorum LMG 25693]
MKFNDLSIKIKLLTLVCISILFIIILSSLIIFRDLNEKNNFNNLQQIIILDNAISELIHETQKERGMTAGFLGGKDKKFKEKLLKQREFTNKQYEIFKETFSNLNKSILGKGSRSYINASIEELKKLENIRSLIDNFNINTKEAISYYTKINSNLLDFVARTSSLSTNSKITKDILSYYNLLMAKERAGIERAVGANTFSRGSFDHGMYAKFSSLISEQNQYMDQFYIYSKTNVISYVQEMLRDKSVEEVEKMRKVLLESEEKTLILGNIQELIGYGGIIHNFKNFVLRKKLKYKEAINNEYKKLNEFIKEYNSFSSTTKKEREQLKNIKETFTKYYEAINAVEVAIKNSKSIKEIDEMVKIDDTPAIKAIQILLKDQFSNEEDYWFDTITKKINILKKIDDFLGEYIAKEIDQFHKKVSNSFYTEISILSIALIVLFLLTYIIYKNISNSTESVYKGIKQFMLYLNREINELEEIKIYGKDELGHIALMANENIKKINKGLEDDMLCVGEAIMVLNRMRQGFYNCKIKSIASNPQVQALAYSVNKTIDIQNSIFEEILKTLEKYSNYDYTASMEKIDYEIGGELQKVLEGINKLRKSITSMLIENQDIGNTLKGSSSTLLENVDVLNTSSNDAAVKLEETVAAIDEISGNIASTNDFVQEMSKNAKILEDSSDKGKELANKTTVSMDEINKQVEEISEATSLIDQIAFQTNILSLNAAVEAATAGEAGKGFAVVAQEVRSLAARSADAANKIKSIVDNATRKSQEGKKIASSMIEGYNNLNSNVQNTVSLIQNIQNASKEQTAGITQINEAVNSLDKQTQENAHVANQANQIALETSKIAKSLVENVRKNNFKGKERV